MSFKISQKSIDLVIDKHLKYSIFKGHFGLEKELLRVDKNGTLVTTPHPQIFGLKEKNPYITTDFSEQQLELITPVCKTIDEAYNVLYDITSIVENSIDDYLWPNSMPCILPSLEKIEYAKFSENKEAETYRKYLLNKYGPAKQMISGIHFNFSMDDDHMYKVFSSKPRTCDFATFKNHFYMKMGKFFLQNRFLFVYLFNATNVFHESFGLQNEDLVKLNNHTCTMKDALSIRTSKYGYTNLKQYKINYENFDAFTNSIAKYVEQGELYDKRELYDLLRFKSRDEKIIDYIEFRNFDLNLFDDNGVSKSQMEFMHLFLVTSSLIKNFKYDDVLQHESYENLEKVNFANHNLDFEISINGEMQSFEKYALNVIDEMEKVAKELQYPSDTIYKTLNNCKKRITKKASFAYDAANSFKDSDFITKSMEIAKARKVRFVKEDYLSKAYGDLELSTQILIKEAIKQGIEFEILDRQDNFLEFTKNNKKQLVKQATKTQADEYASILAMDHKEITKKILNRNNINVPAGEVYTDINEAIGDFYRFENKAIVIKPNATNFGIGVHMVENNNDFELYETMLKEAFSHDRKILIEQLIPGKEYRFFVINGKVVGILHRMPANVVGNGINTIRELIEEKNNHNWRGENYQKPLQKIKIGEVETIFLRSKGMDFDYIPRDKEMIFLRENSNISTGGDSIDFTDVAAVKYCDIAVDAAKCFNAEICGVDMIIQDIEKYNDGYAIIELNWNPAIHIHRFPAVGKPRNIAPEILKLIFKNV